MWSFLKEEQLRQEAPPEDLGGASCKKATSEGDGLCLLVCNVGFAYLSICIESGDVGG